MSEGSSTKAGSKFTVALLTAALGIGIPVGFGIFLHNNKVDAQKSITATTVGLVSTPNGTMPHATLTLGVYADSVSSGAHGPDGGPFPGYVTFGPATHLILPANSLITITINGYDGGESLNHAYFGKVVGTVDGTITLNGQTISRLGMEEVQHTFTLHGLPTSTQEPLFVNVPLGKQSEDAMIVFDETGELPAPMVTVFSFYTKGPGEYVWNCQFPCGDGTYAKFGDAMSKFGYMSGTVSVVEQ